MRTIDEFIDKFEHELLAVDRSGAKNTLNESLKDFEALEIPDIIITPALERIGEKWESGNIALSQVYMSGIICEELLDALFFEKNSIQEDFPPAAIVTFEDRHALGKRIVFSILRSSGLNVLDFGQGIQIDELVKKVSEEGIRILLISTLMLPSALHIKNLRAKLDQMKLKVKLGVGGAPFRFDENLWKQAGADAMGRTASEAVAMIRKMAEELS